MPRAERQTYTKSTHTRCFVAFYTDDANGYNVEEPIAASPELGRIIGVTTSKQLGSASGNFTITVKKDKSRGPRSALRDLWRDPEDVWVRIFFDVDGQRIDTMLGLIDSIQESTQRSGQGQRSETYTITGRDFGKVFETTELFVNFHHAPERPLQSVSALLSTFTEEIIGTPESFIRVLLDFWIGNAGAAEQQWALPRALGGGFLSNILSTNQIQEMEPLVNGEAISPSLFQLDQTGGKLWDVMQEYSNGTLNEMFVDLGPDGNTDPRALEELTPVIYLRERPFPTFDVENNATNNRKWNQLRTRVLERGDVQRRDVAKGGAAHRFNYFQIQLQGIGTEGFNVDEILQRGIDGVAPGFPGNIPIFNTQSIAQHGLRRYNASTRFIPYLEPPQEGAEEPRLNGSRENFFRLAASWLKKLHDWFAIAPFELSGRIQTTRVMPEIRIGERLEERRSEGTIRYYIEGVDHSWTYPNAGTTNLTVTRGEYEDGDLLEHLYEQYENPQALTAREACLIPLDVDPDEIEDLVRQGCTFELPSTPRAVELQLARLEVGNVAEGSGFTVDDPTATQAGQRTLASETDTGRSPRPEEREAPDPGMLPTLDDSSPAVGNPEEIPPAGETEAAPGDPVLGRGRLERGQPIDGLEGLDEPTTDPLAGLEDTLGEP